jgi:hypothetical protein
MHRHIVFYGDPEGLAALGRELAQLDGVIAIAHRPGVALKPPGDLLEIEALNRDADEILRRAGPRLDDPERRVAVAISQSTALIERRRRELIETDADESMWEEMESDLRNHGRISVNYLLLMALGGVIAAVGLLTDPVSQTTAFVGASIIAPGFEPLAKLAQSFMLREWRLSLRAATSSIVGYAVLAGAAFLTVFALARLTARPARDQILSGQALEVLTRAELPTTISSAAAAIAGVIMVVSLRDLYVVGPLMVLVLVSGVTLAAAALAIGEPGLTLAALRRVGVDVGLLLALGAGVFWWKQRRFHRRRPLR